MIKALNLRLEHMLFKIEQLDKYIVPLCGRLVISAFCVIDLADFIEIMRYTRPAD